MVHAIVINFPQLLFCNMNFRYLKLLFFTLLAGIASNSYSQAGNILKLPVMSALCISEDATGFNWDNKKWVRRAFNSGDKYIARKLDPSKYSSDAAQRENKLILCNEPREVDWSKKGKNFTGFVDACYEVKQMGKESTPVVDSRMCSEWWEDGRLKKVSCDKHNAPFFFHPDGAFIRYPWHSDIERNSDNKDSLVLEIGSCSRIN